MQNLLTLPIILTVILWGSMGLSKDLSSIVPLLLLNQSADTPPWGASPPTDADRPDNSWLGQFSNVTPIPVSTTVDAALTQCPQLPAACIIEIDQLQLNQTIYLDRPHTKLLGKYGNIITFSNSSGGSFIELASSIHDIVIERLNLDGQSYNYADKNIFGIIVNGSSIDKIALLKNSIHHLFSNDDAHGIAVYGTGNSENNAVTNIIIDSNIIHDMRTGSSESIAINGNVKNWEITNNEISTINNIAIDAIGGEGTSPVQVVNGRTLPGELDAARYGFIEYNTVTDMSTVTNPSYNNQHSWASAIYVDGAHHLVVAFNSVTASEWAFDIGAENCVIPRHILLENNSAATSYFGDFYIGGYAAVGFNEDQSINCDPLTSNDDNEGHGYLLNITVKNNTFNTPSSSPSPPFVNVIELGNRIRQTVIIQTGITAQHPDGIVTGDQNSIRVNE